jgi:hypothetical protein
LGETSDVDRWVWYERVIGSLEDRVRLVVQVELEMSISDNPFVRTSDNFSYSFNGVYLRVIDGQMDRLDDQACDDEFEFEVDREIDRFRINVSTLAQLRSLCKMLGCRDKEVL